jgi:hypothetical protein
MKENLQNTYETLTKHLCTYVVSNKYYPIIIHQYLCFLHVSFTTWIFFMKIYSTKYLNFVRPSMMPEQKLNVVSCTLKQIKKLKKLCREGYFLLPFNE